MLAKNEAGTIPVRSLPSRLMVSKFGSAPSSDGTIPDILFWLASLPQHRTKRLDCKQNCSQRGCRGCAEDAAQSQRAIDSYHNAANAAKVPVPQRAIPPHAVQLSSKIAQERDTLCLLPTDSHQADVQNTLAPAGALQIGELRDAADPAPDRAGELVRVKITAKHPPKR